MWLQNRSRNLSFFPIKHCFCNVCSIISIHFIFVFIYVESLRWIRKFQRYNARVFSGTGYLAAFVLFLLGRRRFFLRALIHIILINHLIVIIFIQLIFLVVFFIEILIIQILIVDIFFIFLFVILIFAFAFFVFFSFAFFSVFV